MVDWPFQGVGSASIADTLSGATGIASFPNAAAPANNVSIAEVLRYIHATLSGTAAGENGIATWPTAAVYGNNVSIAEVVAWIMDGVRKGTGTGLATNESLVDLIYGANGVSVWPTAAAYGNNVSLAEVLAYIQDGTRRGTGTTLAANESLADVLYAANGIATFPAAAAPANGVSIAEVLREVYDQGERVATKAAATMTNGQTIFTIAGGPIKIVELMSLCVTANDATASTLQYSADPTDGGATTFSGATTTLASIAAGGSVVLNGTALNTAPDISAVGVSLGSVGTRGIIIPAGIITLVIGVGSTTGTWSHHLRYKPMARGVTVT